jgi:hypothetical protein
VEHATRMGQMKNSYSIMVGIAEEKRPFGRSKLRCKDYI